MTLSFKQAPAIEYIQSQIKEASKYQLTEGMINTIRRVTEPVCPPDQHKMLMTYINNNNHLFSVGNKIIETLSTILTKKYFFAIVRTIPELISEAEDLTLDGEMIFLQVEIVNKLSYLAKLNQLVITGHWQALEVLQDLGDMDNVLDNIKQAIEHARNQQPKKEPMSKNEPIIQELKVMMEDNPASTILKKIHDSLVEKPDNEHLGKLAKEIMESYVVVTDLKDKVETIRTENKVSDKESRVLAQLEKMISQHKQLYAHVADSTDKNGVSGAAMENIRNNVLKTFRDEAYATLIRLFDTDPTNFETNVQKANAQFDEFFGNKQVPVNAPFEITENEPPVTRTVDPLITKQEMIVAKDEAKDLINAYNRSVLTNLFKSAVSLESPPDGITGATFNITLPKEYVVAVKKKQELEEKLANWKNPVHELKSLQDAVNIRNGLSYLSDKKITALTSDEHSALRAMIASIRGARVLTGKDGTLFANYVKGIGDNPGTYGSVSSTLHNLLVLAFGYRYGVRGDVKNTELSAHEKQSIMNLAEEISKPNTRYQERLIREHIQEFLLNKKVLTGNQLIANIDKINMSVLK